jgi:tetratricopeptide (TPR) repeat protein
LCVYCARPTRQEDRRCPHCKQTLMMRVPPSRDSEYLRFGLLMLGIYIALGVLPLAGPLFALSVGGRAGVRTMFQLIADYPGVEWFLGPFLTWPETLARMLAMVAGARLAVLGLALAGLRLRWSVIFYFALAVLVLDIALNAFLLANNYMGVAMGAVNIVFALALLSLIGAAYQEFSVVWQRLLNRPDADQRTAAGFFQRGREYSKLGMWGLAVAQWRKSVGLAPKEGVYYKELGLAYARLKRYARSLRTLEEAARQAPKDRELPEIIELVRQQMARDGQDKARR